MFVEISLNRSRKKKGEKESGLTKVLLVVDGAALVEDDVATAADDVSDLAAAEEAEEEGVAEAVAALGSPATLTTALVAAPAAEDARLIMRR